MNYEAAVEVACERLQKKADSVFEDDDSVDDVESAIEAVEMDGLDTYPAMVGAIAEVYANSNYSSAVKTDWHFSRPRWEQHVNECLKETVKVAYTIITGESDETETTQLTSENFGDSDPVESTEDNLDGDLAKMAGAAKAGEGPESPEMYQVSDDLVDIFESQLEERVGVDDTTSFEFLFPLNFQSCKPDSFIVNDFRITGITPEEFEVKSESWDLEGLNHSGESAIDVLERKAIEIENPPADRWWGAEIDTISREAALTRFTTQMEALLGKLNLSIYYHKDIPRSTHPDMLIENELADQPAIVEMPPFVFVQDEEGRQELVELDGSFDTLATFDESIYNTYQTIGLIAFPKAADGASKKLESGLRGFHNGAVADTCDHSFFGYWRALEEVGHDRHDDGSQKTIDRVISLLENSDSDRRWESFGNNIRESLARRRNAMAHGGPRTRVVKRDVIIIREVFIESFPKAIDLLGAQSANDVSVMQSIIDILEESDNINGQISDIEEEIGNLRNKKNAAQTAQLWKTEE